MRYLVLFLTGLGLALTSCGDTSPRLTREQTEWKIFKRGVATDERDYPLEVIEDGYKMIRVYKSQPVKTQTREIPARDTVEWGWKLTVKNKLPVRAVRVTVRYILYDADGFEVADATHYTPQHIEAGKTATIQHTSTMEYDDASRVAESNWEISYRQ